MFGVFGGQHFIESLDMIDLQKQNSIFIQKLNSFIDITMLQLSRAKPGNQDMAKASSTGCRPVS